MQPTNSTALSKGVGNFDGIPRLSKLRRECVELEAAHSDRCAGIEIFLLGLAVDPALGIKPAMHVGPSATAGARENPQAEKDRGSAIPANQASPNSRQNDAKKTPMNPRTHCAIFSEIKRTLARNLRDLSKMLSDVLLRQFLVSASTSRPRCGPGAGHARDSKSTPCFPGLAAPHSGLLEGR